MRTQIVWRVVLVAVLVSMLALFEGMNRVAEAAEGGTLTVDLSGSWNAAVTVELWSSDGSTRLWSKNNQHGATRTYSIESGTYDVVLKQGPQTHTVDDLDCNGDCNVGDVTSTVKVNLDGGWNSAVTVELQTPDGATIWSKTNQHGKNHNYQVLKGTYDLVFTQGATSLKLDNIDCMGDDTTIPTSNVVRKLNVDLSGGWNSAVTVELQTTEGGKVWSATNQHGKNHNYQVLKGNYKLVLKQGELSQPFSGIDCDDDNTDTCNPVDVTSTVGVNLDGGWNSAITVELQTPDGGKIWSATNQHGKNHTYNVIKGTYDLVFTQGATSLKLDNIDCMGDDTTIPTSNVVRKLNVDLSGGWNSAVTVELQTPDGGKIWSATNQHGKNHAYNVLKGTYKLVLKQGELSQPFSGIDCDDDNTDTCNPVDVTSTVGVNLDGGWNSAITVELQTPDGGKIWSATNQHGKNHAYNVIKGTYDLVFTQGAASLKLEDLNCQNDHNIPTNEVVKKLNVDLSGGWNSAITVELQTTEGGKVWSATNQHGKNHNYQVLKGTYKLVLKQGELSQPFSGIDCTGQGDTCTTGDIKSTMGVNLDGGWYAAITVELQTPDGGKIWSATNQHGKNHAYNVIKGTRYNVVFTQGPKSLTVHDVDCDGKDNDVCDAGDVIATLNIDLRGSWNKAINTGLHLNDGATGSIGDRIWTASNQHGAIRTYNVLKNTYDVALGMGNQSYIWDAMNCEGETCTLDKSKLTVKFPGISNVHTTVRKSDGKSGTANGQNVASQNHKNNEVVFNNLENGLYDVVITKGSMIKVVDDVVVLGENAVLDDIVATMTVKFPGISNVHTNVKVDDDQQGKATGGNVDSRNHKNDQTSLAVLKGIYDVTVEKGAQTNIVDKVDCSNGDCTVDGLVVTMTVQFPGISNVHTNVKVDDDQQGKATGGNVDSRNHKNDQTSLAVLKGIYDVTVEKGAQTNIVDKVDCSTSDCVVEDIVATMTVKFPGISNVHTSVKNARGNVDSRNHKNDQTSLAVLKGIYAVTMMKGSATRVVDNVDCTGNTCVVDDIVATMTVKFPGLRNVHVTVSNSSGNVDSRNHKNDQTSLVVLNKNIYTVSLKYNGNTYTWNNVDCTGAICSVENSGLTVKFPGISGVHTYIKESDGKAGTATGRQVARKTNKPNQAVFTDLPNGMYDVIVKKGSETKVIDNVLVLGNNVILDNIVAELTVNFPGISGVHTYVKAQGGGNVDRRTNKTDTTTLKVLKGTYDVVVKKGASSLTTAVDCTGDTCTVDGIVAELTVNFPGISGVHTYVKAQGGGNVDRRTNKTDTTTLKVLKGTYDVVVKKGASSLTTAVDCTGDTCTVDGIVAELTVNFPGISGVHTYVKVDDSTPNSANGGNVDRRTNKTDTTTLKVLKGTYDVVVKKGASTDIADEVNCNDGTCNVVATLP